MIRLLLLIPIVAFLIAKGDVRDDLVSSIDLAPATLGVLGLPVPGHMEGYDFLAADHTPRDHVIAARDRCDFTIERIRAVVTPRFKYLRNDLTDWIERTGDQGQQVETKRASSRYITTGAIGA